MPSVIRRAIGHIILGAWHELTDLILQLLKGALYVDFISNYQSTTKRDADGLGIQVAGCDCKELCGTSKCRKFVAWFRYNL